MKLLSTLICILCISCNSTKIKSDKININITNKSVEILKIHTKKYDSITVFVNKPKNYNYVNTRKFEPVYIFTSNEVLTEKFLNSNISNPFTAEAYIYILIDLKEGEIESFDFINFTKKELFPLIESSYRLYDYKYAIADKNYGKNLSKLIVEETNLFDFYLIIDPSKIILNDFKNINQLENKTLKSINLLYTNQISENQTDSVSELFLINQKSIGEELKNEKDIEKLIKKNSLELADKYNKTISKIEQEFYDDNFSKKDTIIQILEDYEKLKIKLLTPRNTNQLAYTIQSFGNPNLSIKIIDWAIQKFPYDINLYHSKAELYYKIGDIQKSKIALAELKNIVISNKSNLSESTFNYYIRKIEEESSREK